MKGAHDDKTVPPVKSIFQNLVACNSGGPQLGRKAQFFPKSVPHLDKI